MDISTVANVVSGLAAARTADQVNVAVLKKALDAGAEASLALVEALPPVQNLPPNLGNHINTVA